MKYRVDSAVVGSPTLDNVYKVLKPKKKRPARVKKGPYGGGGWYAPIGLNADQSGGDGGGDGGGGGGE